MELVRMWAKVKAHDEAASKTNDNTGNLKQTGFTSLQVSVTVSLEMPKFPHDMDDINNVKVSITLCLWIDRMVFDSSAKVFPEEFAIAAELFFLKLN